MRNDITIAAVAARCLDCLQLLKIEFDDDLQLLRQSRPFQAFFLNSPRKNNDLAGYFGRSFLAGSERLRDNRRMTDAANNRHSETRRPSNRDCIVTTGPSRFQPARPEVLR